MKELEERRKEDSIKRTGRFQEQLRTFVQYEYMHRMRKAKTAIPKMLEIGFQATGQIQTAKVQVSAQAGAAAQVQANQTKFQIYQGKTFERRNAELEQRAQQSLENGNQPNS
jgi:hypothetical protein